MFDTSHLQQFSFLGNPWPPIMWVQLLYRTPEYIWYIWSFHFLKSVRILFKLTLGVKISVPRNLIWVGPPISGNKIFEKGFYILIEKKGFWPCVIFLPKLLCFFHNVVKTVMYKCSSLFWKHNFNKNYMLYKKDLVNTKSI